MNTMHGAFSLAWRNRSRTREAPTPTNISTKSEPDIEKNGTSASPATALASRVLPVPGGPTSRAPFGIFPPRAVYFFWLRRKSTISIISTFASSSPATSLNVTFWVVLFLSYILACDLPTLNTPLGPPPAPILRIGRSRMSHIASSSRGNSSQSITLIQLLFCSSVTTSKRCSSGICSSTWPNSVSASKLPDTRK